MGTIIFSTKWCKDGGNGCNPDLPEEEGESRLEKELAEGTFQPPMVNPDWKPVLCENLDHEPVLIKSRQHYREELKRRGLINTDGGRKWLSPQEKSRMKTRKVFVPKGR